MLASTIVDVPMASKVFDEAVVTYSNESKIKYLGVNSETIERVGVVSEEVVHEMAVGLFNASKANITVAISGIAGPTGGTETKPVGMVCFGLCFNETIYTFTKYFKGSRTSVRKQSVKFAINKLLEILK